MKNILRYSLFGLLIYLISLMLLFPADRAYHWLQQRYNLPVQLYQLSGSVWSGHITLVRVAGMDIKDVGWRVHPLALLMGRLELGLTLAGADKPIALVVGTRSDGSLYINHGDEALSVSELENRFNPQPFGLTGRLEIDLEDIRINGSKLEHVVGTVVWRDAGLAEFLDSSAGDFLLTAVTNNDVVEITIKDQGGPLGLDGLLMLMPDNTYRLSMTLQSRDQGRNDLRQMVNLLGTVSPDGKVTMSRRGRINLSTLLR